MVKHGNSAGIPLFFTVYRTGPLIFTVYRTGPPFLPYTVLDPHFLPYTVLGDPPFTPLMCMFILYIFRNGPHPTNAKIHSKIHSKLTYHTLRCLNIFSVTAKNLIPLNIHKLVVVHLYFMDVQLNYDEYWI